MDEPLAVSTDAEPSDIDTEELRRLTAEATPGPWHTVTTTVDLFVDTPERQVASLNREFYGQADAALIVAMRNAFPGLLDALNAKDRKIAALRGPLENIAGSECIRVPDECPQDDPCPSCEASRALEASEADRG